jgi:tetratricopeptide (TPR) repeat protein
LQAKRGADPLDHYEKALRDYDEILARNPQFVRAYQNRGVVLSMIGTLVRGRGEDPRPYYRKAIASYDDALKRNPRYAMAFHSRGNAFRWLGEVLAERGEDPVPSWKRALASFDGALSVQPRYWQAHYYRGVLLERWGRFEDAAASYEKAVRTARRPPSRVRRDLARVGRAAAAPAWQQKIMVGELARRDGAYLEARGHYRKALALAPPESELPDPGNRKTLAMIHRRLAPLLAMASAGVRAKRAKPAAVPPEEAAGLRADALSHLRKALEIGGSGLESIRDDPGLEALRDLPGFQALLADWEKKPVNPDHPDRPSDETDPPD